MSNKHFKELKGLTHDEIATKIRAVEAELFQVKMKKMTGQLTDSAQPWRLRKEVARMKTLVTQKAMAAKAPKKAASAPAGKN